MQNPSTNYHLPTTYPSMPRPLRLPLPLLLTAVVIAVAGFGCTPQESAEVKAASQPFALTVWGVWDNPDDIAPVFAAFHQQLPYVAVEYRKFRYEEYEQAILESAVTGTGPDVIALHNTWMLKYQPRLLAAPAALHLVATQTSGPQYQQKTVRVLQDVPGIQPKDVRQKFVDVVAGDAVVGEKVYGLPLSLDTLALFYNKQLLNAAGISAPPKTWEEFKQQVRQLTAQDTEGNIAQAGAALGTSSNVPRSADILALLMLQNGTKMLSGSGQSATFHLPVGQGDSAFVPGADALRFYTDFASPSKEVYSWSAQQSDALQAFAEGKLAFFLGYAYHIPVLRTQAPQLAFGVSTVPQISATGTKVNFVNYWLYGTMAATKHPNEAWALVQFLGSEEAQKIYSAKAGKPSGLRSLIDAQSQDEKLGAFSSGLLTASSWYHGKNSNAAEAAMKDAIDAVVAGTRDTQAALNVAAERVNQTLR